MDLLRPSVSLAGTFTVSSSAQLQAALRAAQNNGQDDTINIAPGAFNTGIAEFSYIAAAGENFALTLTGAGAGVTVLNGRGVTPVLKISTLLVGSDGQAKITISNLTIQNGKNTAGEGGGLDLSTNGGSIVIENCRFLTNGSDGPAGTVRGGGALVQSAAGDITMSNNSFTSNFVDGLSGQALGGGAFIESMTGAITLTGNELANNASRSASGNALGGSVAALSRGSATITLSQNFFANNSASSLSASAQGGGAAIAQSGSGGVVLSGNVLFMNTVGSAQFANGGGAVVLTGSGRADLTRNSFGNNTASAADA